MKKLIIMTALICVAVMSHAASIDWSVSTRSWTLADGSKAASGTTVYLINGTTALDTIAAAVNLGASAITSADWYYASSATDNTNGRVSSLTSDSDSLTAGTEYNFSVLIVDGDKYMVSAAAQQNAYNPAKEEPLPIAFTSSMFNANSQTASVAGAVNGWAPVPEPTSGLLLLIGMGALALRRKRA